MDNNCVLCFDEMDMRSYQDERQSTGICFKLECGHAYHTKCIIDCLTKSNIGCPNCNAHRRPENELTIKGIVAKVVREIKRDPELQALKHEYVLSMKELSATKKQIKKDTKEFIRKRKQELLFEDKRKYHVQCVSAYRRKIFEVAQKKSPVHLGVLYKNPTFRKYYNVDRLFFNQGSSFTRWRLQSKTIYANG
jgi:hypothetical protein